MSRIGKKPIEIPSNVQVEIGDRIVKVKGPKGEINQPLAEDILVEKKDNCLFLSPRRLLKQTPALWGLTRALLQNHIKGVSEGFVKKLEIIGIGYKAALKNSKELELEVGYSHPVFLAIPDGLNVSVEKNIITISGYDKQKVGEFAANARKTRPPEPYKGKGIRYLGEKVRKKEGKKAATATK